MGKHLVDIDEAALHAARGKLSTNTIKETVNRALRHVVGEDAKAVKKNLDLLSKADLVSREQAWH